MLKVTDKNTNRQARHSRVRNKVSGTAERPRLSVYRSLSEIYAQLIDDTKGVTLLSASSKDAEIAKAISGKTKTQISVLVGETLAKAAKKKGITKVVFDRGGYLYIGRVKAVADGARAAGLEF